MNNAEKNTYVKQRITAAMIELLQEKAMKDISVSDLCRQAGVGRASFYRNYRTKEEVILRHLADLLRRWSRKYEGRTDFNLIEAIFEHFYENREIFILLYKRGLAYLSLDSVKSACGAKPHQDNMTAYTAAFISYGLYGWIEEWFKRGMPETPRQMAMLWKNTQNILNGNK